MITLELEEKKRAHTLPAFSGDNISGRRFQCAPTGRATACCPKEVSMPDITEHWSDPERDLLRMRARTVFCLAMFPSRYQGFIYTPSTTFQLYSQHHLLELFQKYLNIGVYICALQPPSLPHHLFGMAYALGSYGTKHDLNLHSLLRSNISSHSLACTNFQDSSCRYHSMVFIYQS